MRTLIRSLAPVTLLVVVACGAPSRPPPEDDDETTPDAAAQLDEPDAGGEDAGADETPDAGTEPVVDAGEIETPDAGPVEAPDAGPVAVTLTVTMTSARNNTGRTCLAIYDDASAFPNDSARAVFNQCLGSVNGPFVIEGLVDGRTYGISAFHDENGNSALDTRNVVFAEAPEEGYGFSNNPAVGFGPPTWSAVQFAFDASKRAISIKLNYLF